MCVCIGNHLHVHKCTHVQMCVYMYMHAEYVHVCLCGLGNVQIDMHVFTHVYSAWKWGQN